MANLLGELPLGAPLAHYHVSPAGERFESHVYVADATSAVLVVESPHSASGSHRQRLAHVFKELWQGRSSKQTTGRCLS